MACNDSSTCCSLRRHYLHLYENQIKYDVVLLCDDDNPNGKRALKVHRVFLSAFCSYFRELFEMDFFTRSEDFSGLNHHPTVIVMKGYDYSILKKVIDFLYKGDCKLEKDQIKRVRSYVYELGVQLMIDFLNKSATSHISDGFAPTDASFCGHSRHTSKANHTHPRKEKSAPSSPHVEDGHESDKQRLFSDRDESQIGGDDEEGKYSPYSHDDYIMPSSPMLEPLVQLVTPCDDTNPSEFDHGSEPTVYRYPGMEPSAGSSVEKEIDKDAVRMYLRTISKAEERKLNPKNISKRTCPVCHKVFTRVDTMRSHFRGMHLQQKLLCDQCSMSFKWKSHLRRHYKLYHSSEHTANNKDSQILPD